MRISGFIDVIILIPGQKGFTTGIHNDYVQQQNTV